MFKCKSTSETNAFRSFISNLHVKDMLKTCSISADIKNNSSCRFNGSCTTIRFWYVIKRTSNKENMKKCKLSIYNFFSKLYVISSVYDIFYAPKSNRFGEMIQFNDNKVLNFTQKGMKKSHGTKLCECVLFLNK